MAEVLGIVASVVAVIQLTEVVDKKVAEYLHTVKSARSVLVPLLSKLRHLVAILKTLQLELNNPNSLAFQHLAEPLNVCKAVMTRLQTRLDNLKIIGGCVIGPLLDKDNLRNLKHLDDLIPVLQLALDTDTITSTHAIEDYLTSLRLENWEQAELLRRNIQAHHEDARKWKEEDDERRDKAADIQLKESILTWLAVVDPEINYLAACRRKQPGTGNWFLDSSQFADWEDGKARYMWLNAMAGAGKTILSSTIISQLIAKHGQNRLAYYFFDFKDTSKQDVKNLLGSLLLQATKTMETTPEPLSQLFQRHKLRSPERPTSPTKDELLETLVRVLHTCPITFIIIDALDESNEVGSLLETLCALFERLDSNCRIIVTSRAEHEIQRVLEKQNIQNLQIQRNDVDHDVALHVRAVLETDDRLRAHRQGIKDLITATLTEGAQGMFRWVQCQIDHIKTLRTANDIKKALRGLPPTLDQTYDRILSSVKPEDQSMLHRALQLIVFAARPLGLEEIAEAVMITPGVFEIDEDDRLQRPEDLLDIGKSLFVQGASPPSTSQIFELSHYSVEEYLLSDRIKKGPAAAFALNEVDAELKNTHCLLTYLGLDVFSIGWHDFDTRIAKSPDLQIEADHVLKEADQRLAEYPLLSYAARYCLGHHCKSEIVQREFSPLILDLFMPPQIGRFYNLEYVCVYNALDSMATLERLFRYSLLNVAARFNLSIIVQDLLAAGVPVDDLPSRPNRIKEFPEGQTALYRAADFGHVDLCKLLIEAGANIQGTETYDCPLSAAGRSGKPEIVHLMLDAGASPAKDATPLAETQLAIWWRYIEEKSEKWRDILDILRDAGARWSTVTLLAAFSHTTKGLMSPAVDNILLDTDGGARKQADCLGDVVDTMDTNTLNALQWLAQDEGGTGGLRKQLKTTLRAAYESQPQLFVPVSGFTTQRFSVEEMIAENLIRIYFRPAASHTNTASQELSERSERLLNTLWDNRNQADKATTKDSEDPSATSRANEPSGDVDVSTNEPSRNTTDFIVYGDILQAWSRARWDAAYSHFFD